jgi:hypothetical protein
MGYLPCEENWVVRRGTIYNYGTLCRETSRFVILRGMLFFPRVDKSGCFLTQRAVIVLLYFCQCLIGYLPCGGKLGCSAGNNVQLLPALKLNNYDVHRKCRKYLFYYTETLFTIMLDAINTYLCVFINFIFVLLTSGQDCNSGMQKRIHFRTDMEHYICRPCFPGVPIL